MINFELILVLGAIAGFTIYFGLATARIRVMKGNTRYFLSSVATGILIFLIYDVTSNSWSLVEGSFTGGQINSTSFLYLILFFLGLGLGIIGLSTYEHSFLNRKRAGSGKPEADSRANSYRLSLMIAVGIGAHNFGEGLAIGSSFASGAIALATVLVIGFGLHNSTEGFGILGPLIRDSERPTVRYLFMAGLIGGGPTFLGTVIGSMWASDLASILFLSFAGGALIYVTLTMYRAIAPSYPGNRLMAGLFVGVALGFLTDLIVSIGGA